MRPCLPFPVATSQNDQWSFAAYATSQDPHDMDLVLVNEHKPASKSPFRRERSWSTATIRGRPSQKLPSVFEAWEDEHGGADDDFEWDDDMPARPETPAFDTSPTKLLDADVAFPPSSPCTPALDDLPDIEDESSSDEDVNAVFTPPSPYGTPTPAALEPRIHFMGTRHFEEWDKPDFVECHALLQLAPTDIRGLLAPPPRAALEILCSSAPAPRPGCPSPPSRWAAVPEHALRWRSDSAALERWADPRFDTLVEDSIRVNPSWMRPQNSLQAAGAGAADGALDGWARLVSVRIPTRWLRGSQPRTFVLEAIIEEEGDGESPWPTVRAEMTVANLRWRDVAPGRR
ncbi:hypothetical protein HDZ31DRAFT_59607 [Schizophyllum fasciatum]